METDPKSTVHKFTVQRVLLVGLAVTLLVLVVRLINSQYGSVSTLIRYLNGHRHNVGEIQYVDTDSRVGIVFVEIPITNCTNNAMTVTGLRSSCTCLNPTNLPLSIPAFQRENVKLEYAVLKTGNERQSVWILLDYYDSIRKEVSLTLRIPDERFAVFAGR